MNSTLEQACRGIWSSSYRQVGMRRPTRDYSIWPDSSWYALLCLTLFGDDQHTLPSMRLRLYQSDALFADVFPAIRNHATTCRRRIPNGPLALTNESAEQTLH